MLPARLLELELELGLVLVQALELLQVLVARRSARLAPLKKAGWISRPGSTPWPILFAMFPPTSGSGCPSSVMKRGSWMPPDATTTFPIAPD